MTFFNRLRAAKRESKLRTLWYTTYGWNGIVTYHTWGYRGKGYLDYPELSFLDQGKHASAFVHCVKDPDQEYMYNIPKNWELTSCRKLSRLTSN